MGLWRSQGGLGVFMPGGGGGRELKRRRLIGFWGVLSHKGGERETVVGDGGQREEPAGGTLQAVPITRQTNLYEGGVGL